jgi:tetratricopeptide (TPR) repeat protein
MKMREILTIVALELCVTAAFAQTGADYDALIQQGKSQLQAGNTSHALILGEQGIKSDPTRWEAYALSGGALMNLHRYEEAADELSDAIKHAPESKQAGLRDLRKQCVLAEAGAVVPAPPTVNQPSVAEAMPAATQAEIVLWKSIEKSKNPQDFQGYLKQYPNGAFATLAQGRLDGIQKAKEEEHAEEQRKRGEEAQNAWLNGKSFSVGYQCLGGMGWCYPANLSISARGVSLEDPNRPNSGFPTAACSGLTWDLHGATQIIIRLKASGKQFKTGPGYATYDHSAATKEEVAKIDDVMKTYCKSN